jgi:CxxC motif-containing protein (DUF1111 family)
MVLDGTVDLVENSIAMSPTDDPDRDGVVNEVPLSILDHLEFFQLNSFKPGHYQETITSLLGRIEFHKMGCASCHTPNMRIDRDRRAVDAETSYDEQRGGPFNQLFAEVTLLSGGEFLVRDLFADFKRHDMGAGFWELHFDGSITMFFLTEPLWGIATTAPYGYDGRSINLREVILRHGGESKPSRDEFARAPAVKQERVIAFLNSLVLFGPPDTASNLDPGNPRQPDFPVFGHGSIDLAVLFTNACGVAGPE